ncbi:MAG: hypothetical protein ACI9EK_001248, partial [Psychroserpens sp.]
DLFTAGKFKSLINKRFTCCFFVLDTFKKSITSSTNN